MSEEAKTYTCSVCGKPTPNAAMNCPASEEPTHAYNVVSGMCDACADRCGVTLCQARALHSICHRIHSLLADDGK